MFDAAAEGKWAIFRAREGAYLVNGSYEFTRGDFRGEIATPGGPIYNMDQNGTRVLIKADATVAAAAQSPDIPPFEVDYELAPLGATAPSRRSHQPRINDKCRTRPCL